MRGGWLYHFETRSCTPKESWRKFWSPSWVWLSDWELWKWHTFQDIVSRPKAATWFRVNQCSENLSSVADLIPSPTSGLEKSGIWSYEAVHHKHFPICTSWNIPGPGNFFWCICVHESQTKPSFATCGCSFQHPVGQGLIPASPETWRCGSPEGWRLLLAADNRALQRSFFGSRMHFFLKSDHVEIVARRGLRGCDCYASSHDIAWNCCTLIWYHKGPPNMSES